MQWSQRITETISKLGFAALTDVQLALAERIMNRKSVVAIAATGTGKTHGFLLPAFELVDPSVQKCQVLIVCPTRELAAQTYGFARKINEQFNLKVANFIGGRDIGEDEKAAQVQPQIVVGTPSRLQQLVKRGAVSLASTKLLVIDEADTAFDLDFGADVTFLNEQAGTTAIKALVAATMSEALANHVKRLVGGAEVVRISDAWSNPLIEHVLLKTSGISKEQTLLVLLEVINPFVSVIFANTKKTAEQIHKLLVSKKYQSVLISGELPVRERKAAFKRAADHQFKYVVATDIASRGLDIQGLTDVISYELPKDIAWYAHRAGRTGRANSKGRSFVLFDEEEQQLVDKITSKGVAFQRGRIEKNSLVVLPPAKKKVRQARMDETELAIRKAIATHDFRVRPGYKRALREKIAKIKQVNKRKRIEESVRHQLEIKWKKQSAAKRRASEEKEPGGDSKKQSSNE